MNTTDSTTTTPARHWVRLTRIKGWGVRCDCGFDWQPRGPRGGRVSVTKGEAVLVHREHCATHGQVSTL